MKTNIFILLITIITITFFWQAEIYEDKKKAVKISEFVPAFNDWECGYQNIGSCTIVFEVIPTKTFQVKGIQYTKDFMAIKIIQKGKVGWVINGKGVEVYNPNDT
ncbi:hypothetical protein L1077_26720 [Pseudoalteromonas luteoviolacea]|uniref:hypothetical protein n=1 Tax=Pseudoalteromonas luteoviolacea TaxID=43657 RepID=UPI001F171F6F|nr:hypothetical protein [Pseudoalteromonas luteoviolacea]MCF6443023.1 hypothetical protein [Pseudoalteromonas luteoviolacea]